MKKKLIENKDIEERIKSIIKKVEHPDYVDREMLSSSESIAMFKNNDRRPSRLCDNTTNSVIDDPSRKSKEKYEGDKKSITGDKNFEEYLKSVIKKVEHPDYVDREMLSSSESIAMFKNNYEGGFR